MLLNAHRMIQGASRRATHLAAIEDITVRKRAERLRQETEDRLRTMVDTAVDAIVTIDEARDHQLGQCRRPSECSAIRLTK